MLNMKESSHKTVPQAHTHTQTQGSKLPSPPTIILYVSYFQTKNKTKQNFSLSYNALHLLSYILTEEDEAN